MATQLPPYIYLEDPRLSFYKKASNLFHARHNEEFDIDEFEYKLTADDFLCFDLLRIASTIKRDLIWIEAPAITFENETLQDEWDEMRTDSAFDEMMKQITIDSFMFGDGLSKTIVDKQNLTADENDKVVSIYPVNPQIWFPDYNKYNVSKPADSDSLVISKDEKDDPALQGMVAYLIERNYPGKVEYESWICYNYDYMEKNEMNKEDRCKQVSPNLYFSDVLADVLVDGDMSEDDMILTYTTKVNYSLIARLPNKKDTSCYFGHSDYNNAVISKIKALDKYANLADFLISTNSVPPFQVTEAAMKLVTQAKQEATAVNNQDMLDIPETFTRDYKTMNKATVYSKTFAQSLNYRKAMDKLKIIPDDAGRGENKFLNNPFDLEQIKTQSDKLFSSLMTELDISEVFYNPSISTGAKSGIAYKRLMTLTLNAAENVKQKLEVILPRVIYTMLQLGKQNEIITSEPEMPVVRFADGLADDSVEKIDNWIKLIQNNLASKKQAIQDIHGLDMEQTESLLIDIANDEPEVEEQPSENVIDISEEE